MYKYEIHMQGSKKTTLEKGYNRIALWARRLPDCERATSKFEIASAGVHGGMEKQQKIVS